MIKELILEKAVSDIKKDCSKFLSEVTKPLYRGMKGTGKDIGSGILLCNIRTDRKPRDSGIEIHKIVNNFFIKEYNIPFRSAALFCSFNLEETESYGNVYKIYPIGNFDYIWSEVIYDAFAIFETYWNGKLPSDIREMLIEACKDLNINLKERASSAIFHRNKPPHSIISYITPSEKYVVIKKLFDKFGSELYYFNKKLKEAQNTSSEIMISCNQYYAVPIDLEIKL